MKKVLKCFVADEYVVGTDVSIGAAGSHNDVLLELTFSPLWDGTTKQIVWKDALGENPTVCLLTEEMRIEGTNTYQVPIPAEAKREEGLCSMYVRGTIVNDGVEESCTMTVRAHFRVMPSGKDENAEESQDVTPSQAVQLQQQVDKALEAAQSIFKLEADLNDIKASLAAKADNHEFDSATSLLWLLSNGERIGDGVKVATSGGGGAYAEVVDNLPTPSESQRGKFLIAPNGDTDILYICMRINGIYTWAEFVPQINSETDVVYLVDLYGTKLKTADSLYLSTNV